MHAGPVFRVFVSSTFSDFHAERNALQERVWPKLRDLCRQHGARFQAVDLRWGVSDEAGHSQRTMRICLGEIDRCQRITPRPNVIILLGDRYGWQPLPWAIPTSEFEQIREVLPQFVDEPTAAALLERWYRPDDNAVPSYYLLQSRTDKYVEGTHWVPVEERLRALLQTVASRLGLSDDGQDRYLSSATEQEIRHGVLRLPNPRDCVFAFFRSIEHLPTDRRSAAGFVDLMADGEIDPVARQRLRRLKNTLRERLCDNVAEYGVSWADGRPVNTHLDAFCADVQDRLSRVILDELGRPGKSRGDKDEVADHDRFAIERTDVFVGRTHAISSVVEHITTGRAEPFAIIGVPGAGKTALLAEVSNRVEAILPNAVMVRRFIGAMPSSTDLRSLLASVCEEIALRYGQPWQPAPMELMPLVTEFGRRLEFASPARPLVLFLDALDRLSGDEGRVLHWLPRHLPRCVSLIVSSGPGETRAIIEKETSADTRLELGPMTEEEAWAVVDRCLKSAERTLQPEQRTLVTERVQSCSLPLYLRLLAQEACQWPSYAELAELSKRTSGRTVRELMVHLLAGLSDEANHGFDLVLRTLGYMVASKNGLAEDELLDLLSRDEKVMAAFRRRSPYSPKADRLPMVVWTRLRDDLEPYLAEYSADGAILLGFFHQVLGDVVLEYLKQVPDAQEAIHRGLLNYFSAQESSKRKASEFPHQCLWLREWELLRQSVEDIGFLDRMFEADRYQTLECWKRLQREVGFDPLQVYSRVFSDSQDCSPDDRIIGLTRLGQLADAADQPELAVQANYLLQEVLFHFAAESGDVEACRVGLVCQLRVARNVARVGKLDAALKLLEQGVLLARGINDTELAGQFYSERAVILIEAGRLAEADTALSELSRALSPNDEHAAAILAGLRAQIEVRSDRATAALPLLNEQERLLRKVGVGTDKLDECLLNRGTVLTMLERYEAALRDFNACMRGFDRRCQEDYLKEAMRRRFHALGYLAIRALNSRQMVELAEYVVGLVCDARTLEDPELIRCANVTYANVVKQWQSYALQYLRAGQTELAWQVLNLHQRVCERINDSASLAHLLMTKGAILRDRSAFEDALRAFDYGRRLAEQANLPALMAQANIELGILHRHCGNTDRALQYFDEAACIARVQGLPELVSRADSIREGKTT